MNRQIYRHTHIHTYTHGNSLHTNLEGSTNNISLEEIRDRYVSIIWMSGEDYLKWVCILLFFFFFSLWGGGELNHPLSLRTWESGRHETERRLSTMDFLILSDI